MPTRRTLARICAWEDATLRLKPTHPDRHHAGGIARFVILSERCVSKNPHRLRRVDRYQQGLTVFVETLRIGRRTPSLRVTSFGQRCRTSNLGHCKSLTCNRCSDHCGAGVPPARVSGTSTAHTPDRCLDLCGAGVPPARVSEPFPALTLDRCLGVCGAGVPPARVSGASTYGQYQTPREGREGK
jgi:hypothetical protein